MRPSILSLQILWGWIVLGIAAAFLPMLTPAWMVAGVVIGCAALIDFFWAIGKCRITIVRKVPLRFALGERQEVTLEIKNHHPHAVHVKLFDGLPDTFVSEDLPWSDKIPAKRFAKVTYHLKAMERGPHQLERCHLLQRSFLGLWQKSRRLGTEDMVKVYPNYEPVIRYHLCSMQNRVDQMGIVSLNRPGVSKEFHQLRDYQEGDVLTQIDWKATSRRNSLISREYRQQRDQTLIFAIDCGRRMRVMDGAISQFDHCLNSILLLSHIALRQGDSVGILGFGGTPRWLPPVKGAHQMPVILNHLYDYQTSPEPTDFSEAVERLTVMQKRRAMVVFLTNLRSEDASHLMAPLQLLRKKHLVLLASLQEQEVRNRLLEPVKTLDEALTYSATHLYLEDRAALLAKLREQRIMTVDASALTLPVALVNQYLEIKKEGKL